MPFFIQAWTERAKGLTGDVKDLKKRKRTEAGGGIENQIGQVEANENDAKKKKAMDPSSKLSAFAFHKNWSVIGGSYFDVKLFYI